MSLRYPADTNSFSDAGTRRCSTLYLRSVCVSSAKMEARSASGDSTGFSPAWLDPDVGAGGEIEVRPHPMSEAEIAQRLITRKDIRPFSRND